MQKKTGDTMPPVAKLRKIRLIEFHPIVFYLAFIL